MNKNSRIRNLLSEQTDISVIKSIPDELLEKVEKAAELLSPSDHEESVLRTADMLLYNLFEAFSEPDTWKITLYGEEGATVSIHKDLPDVYVKYDIARDGGVFVPISGITSADPGCEEMVKIFADKVAEMVYWDLGKAA